MDPREYKRRLRELNRKPVVDFEEYILLPNTTTGLLFKFVGTRIQLMEKLMEIRKNYRLEDGSINEAISYLDMVSDCAFSTEFMNFATVYNKGSVPVDNKPAYYRNIIGSNVFKDLRLYALTTLELGGRGIATAILRNGGRVDVRRLRPKVKAVVRDFTESIVKEVDTLSGLLGTLGGTLCKLFRSLDNDMSDYASCFRRGLSDIYLKTSPTVSQSWVVVGEGNEMDYEFDPDTGEFCEVYRPERDESPVSVVEESLVSVEQTQTEDNPAAGAGH
jgi:hypothetical protein